jgi:hypothetical protein
LTSPLDDLAAAPDFADAAVSIEVNLDWAVAEIAMRVMSRIIQHSPNPSGNAPTKVRLIGQIKVIHVDQSIWIANKQPAWLTHDGDDFGIRLADSHLA